MKILIIVLVCLFVGLQYRLWFGTGSVSNVRELKGEILVQEVENARIGEQNRILAAEVSALKNEPGKIESIARKELGMIKEGETLYKIIDEK